MEQDLFHLNNNRNFFNSSLSISLCFLLSCVYLGSLHVWKTPFDRNHPSTIKKRFLSVFIMLFIAPCFLHVGLNRAISEKFSFYHILGVKSEGLWQAIVLPLCLTAILFLGPICMEIHNGITKVYLEPSYWYSNLTNLIWLRNVIVAPFTEEFTYRCCMLPLLLQYFQPFTAICVNPLFFGLAHFHHLHERLKFGMEFDIALKVSCFQFAYTTIFGMYSAYLFYKTGHFVSIFVVHAFCNHMGFPNVMEIASYNRNKQFLFISLFIVGFTMWLMLLKPLTAPSWYSNRMPWLQS